jgi:nucleotide-binding universal stress UspA family protein
MFKKILVPYDTSKPSEKALRWAADLTRSMEKSSCEIVILHVVPRVPATPIFVERPVNTRGGQVLLSEYIKTLYIEMQTRAREMLERKKKDVEEMTDAKATVRTMVQIGDSIADEICILAKKEKADLIVIGNVGLSGLSKLKTLGSVSRGVSERAPCPVVIVH